ncbi:MAG: hypothetical protein KBT11_03305 [Treponema sp.]|nr:hypothetical protein [Candidatus Treponema equifaecale]
MKITIKSVSNFIKNNLKIFGIAAIALVLFCAVGYFVKHFGTSRRSFQFAQVGSEKIEREVRYISNKNGMSALEGYISELLLGPQIHRARPLFTLGTSLEFCIEKDEKLFVGLSEEAIFQESDSVEVYEGIELLKKNIMENFNKYKEIEIFINGISIETKN